MASYRVYETTADIDAMEIRTRLATDGAVVVQGVLSSEEVALTRRIVSEHLSKSGIRLMLGKTQPNAAIAVPSLTFVFSHPKIVAICQKLYGEDQVVFTGHCDIHMNMISGWHKDSGEGTGGYFRGDYFGADDCRVYKVATYLQDSDASDGLTVRLASHRTSSIKAGEEIKLTTKAGDIVIFDVRLNHTGRIPNLVERALKNASRLLNGGNRNRQDSPLITAVARAVSLLYGRKDRMSVFFTYGPPNRFTYDFAYYNMERQQKQIANTQTRLPEALVAQLRSRGVTPFDTKTYTPV